MKFPFVKFKMQMKNTFGAVYYMQCHISEYVPAFTSFLYFLK